MQFAGSHPAALVAIRPKSVRRLPAQRPPPAAVNSQPMNKGAGRVGQVRPMRLRYTLSALTDLASILDCVADRFRAMESASSSMQHLAEQDLAFGLNDPDAEIGIKIIPIELKTREDKSDKERRVRG
jgi:hypothetical protein